jgi:peptidyl-prolyl cis-trans isomerase SurA
MIKRSILLVSALFALPAAGAAQINDSDVVDRLIAVVGDSVVVQTQVYEEIQRMALGGAAVPNPGEPGYDRLFRSILDQYVDQLLVLQAAAKDSLIEPNEPQIAAQVDERIAQLSQQFGGQAQLQQALAAEALTLAEYREILSSEARKEQVQQMFFQARTSQAPPIELTEDELRERFQEAQSQLQDRPRLLTFRQVVVAPEASEAALAEARALADSLVERIAAGEDFAALATEYSADPGSAQLGGDLGWFRRGRMVREFEDAAFDLRFIGQVSDPVQTEYGFHIIKLERQRAGERSARHILIIPKMTDTDLGRARETAAEVHRLAESGSSMKDLFEQYSDPAAPDSLTLAFDQLGDLPPAYAPLQTAPAGTILGPLEYQSGPEETRIAVVKVVEIRDAGAYTFEDLRPSIAAQLQQEKQLERLLDELRATTYIDIRM